MSHRVQTIQVPHSLHFRQPLYAFLTYPNIKIVILLCRRGNKSHAMRQQFAEALGRILPRRASSGDLTALSNGDTEEATAKPVAVQVLDVAGGLQAWSEQVDSKFPVY